MLRSRRAPLGLVLLLLAAGCSDGGLPTEPVDPGNPLLAVFDGAHDGIEGFYFLPPMVKKPTYAGTFDPTLSPVVEICETTACTELHQIFSMTEGAGSELVRLDEVNEHYVVNWHTDRTGPDGLGTEVGQTYRVRVQVAGTVLGYADVQMAGNGKEARNMTTDDVITLVDGRTLPIKFRIEEGTVFVVGSGGGTFTSSDGAVTIEVPQGAVAGDIGIIVTPVTDNLEDPDVVPGLAFEFLPSPHTFAKPVILTVVYDASSLPIGIAENELRLLAFVGDEWVQLPGSAVNVANSTVSGPLDGFSRKAVGRGKVHAIAVTPADAAIEVGGTQEFVATVTNVDGEVMSRNVQWSSSDEAVATVDNNGLATGVALGAATIEAKSGKVSGSVVLVVAAADVSSAFVTRWNTNLSWGTTITLGLSGPVDATIDWGDGEITTWTTAGTFSRPSHTYSEEGVYTVSVTGSVAAYQSQNIGNDMHKLVEVVAWGDVGFIRLHRAFEEARNLVVVPTSTAGLESVIDMSFMFHNARSFDHNIGGWDVGNVEDMSYMFLNAYAFNQDIGGWNTANVWNMRAMFANTRAFNQDIGGWSTGLVRVMENMFSGAMAFNQNIGGWNTANVTNMRGMFLGSVFNQDIGGWDTGNVTRMDFMFMRASFNQDIGNWDTRNVNRMDGMFSLTTAFNQDIGRWNTGNVSDMSRMFDRATAFNQNIGGWNTGNVTNMATMFNGATAFNRDLSGWCVTNITSMPSNFDTGATSWTLARPAWGTCPT